MLGIVLFRCDELEIKINNLLDEHMFVCRTASFRYKTKSSKLAKSFVQERIASMRLISKVIIVSARRFSAAADRALHIGMSEQR